MAMLDFFFQKINKINDSQWVLSISNHILKLITHFIFIESIMNELLKQTGN